MKIEVYRALWGMEGSLEHQFERIAAAGYDGVEVWLSFTNFDRNTIVRLCEQHQLRLIVAGRSAIAAQNPTDTPILQRISIRSRSTSKAASTR